MRKSHPFSFSMSITFFVYISDYMIKILKSEVIIIKKIINIIAVFLTISIFTTVMANAESKHGWYIVKHEGATPGFPSDADFLSDHSCYFIDKRCNRSGEKVIYLTFDAGYENGNIEKILDTLKSEKVPAAFFVLSNLIKKNTALVARMFEDGHLVCNHTQNHECLPGSSTSQIIENLSGLEKLCKSKTGREMSKFFRYPEGTYDKESALILENIGYKTFFWSMAYADWDNSRQPSEELAFKSLIKQTHPGAIVLLHPTSSTNASVLPKLISAWRDMGYRFGTLDEIVR